MHRSMRLFLSLALIIGAISSFAATGRVVKVLPHYLDLKGRHTLSPSLYDRDAYQAQLRQHPEQRSGMGYDVQWKSPGNAGKTLKLRVELRGMARGDLPRSAVLEKALPEGRGRGWTRLALAGADYEQLGEVTAWRVTLLDGDTVLSQQSSFLW